MEESYQNNSSAAIAHEIPLGGHLHKQFTSTCTCTIGSRKYASCFAHYSKSGEGACVWIFNLSHTCTPFFICSPIFMSKVDNNDDGPSFLEQQLRWTCTTGNQLCLCLYKDMQEASKRQYNPPYLWLNLTSKKGGRNFEWVRYKRISVSLRSQCKQQKMLRICWKGAMFSNLWYVCSCYSA